MLVQFLLVLLAILTQDAIGSPQPKDIEATLSSERSAPSRSEQRIAIVIGNSSYRYTASIPGAVHDSRLIRDVLVASDFDVIYLEDAGREAMELAVAQFASKAREASVTLVYYSGHGVQVDGNNFLLPVDADIPDPNFLESEAIPVESQLIAKVARGGAPLNIVLLDACRNNPFAKSWTSSSKSVVDRGLSSIDAMPGFVIGYATSPGDTALDGGVRPGPYAQALAQEMRIAGQSLDDVLKGTYERVRLATHGEQVPWISMAVGKVKFVFLPEAGPESVIPVAVPPRGPPPIVTPAGYHGSYRLAAMKSYARRTSLGSEAASAHTRSTVTGAILSVCVVPLVAVSVSYAGKSGSLTQLIAVPAGIGAAGAAIGATFPFSKLPALRDNLEKAISGEY